MDIDLPGFILRPPKKTPAHSWEKMEDGRWRIISTFYRTINMNKGRQEDPVPSKPLSTR